MPVPLDYRTPEPPPTRDPGGCVVNFVGCVGVVALFMVVTWVLIILVMLAISAFTAPAR